MTDHGLLMDCTHGGSIRIVYIYVNVAYWRKYMKWENVGEPVGFGAALAAMESDSERVFYSNIDHYSVKFGDFCYLKHLDKGSWHPIDHSSKDLQIYMSRQWQEVKQAAEPVSWEVARKDMVENGAVYRRDSSNRDCSQWSYKICAGELKSSHDYHVGCWGKSSLEYNFAAESMWIKQ